MFGTRARLSPEMVPSAEENVNGEHGSTGWSSSWACWGLSGNEAPCWGEDASERVLPLRLLLLGCSCHHNSAALHMCEIHFRGVVLLGFTMVSMLTWFGSLDAAPTGPLLRKTLSVSLPLFLHGKTHTHTHTISAFGERIKCLHMVSSSDSFISKPRARRGVPRRGIFISDLLYCLFCLSVRQHFRVIVRLTYKFIWDESVIFQIQAVFQQWHTVGSAVQKMFQTNDKLGGPALPQEVSKLTKKILVIHLPLVIINLH